jgi:type I restriction enzyme S subunit
MSEIKKLIERLCPDGVEYKKLGEVIISLKTGLNPRKNFVLNEPGSNRPYITGKDIFNNRINVSDKTDLITDDALKLINKRACLENGLLLFASTGTGTVGRMAIIENYKNDWAMSETLYAIKTKEQLLPKFLMYYLYSENSRNQFEPKISKGSVPHLKVSDLQNVLLPVPPIEVQSKIVEILDNFTELEAEL